MTSLFLPRQGAKKILLTTHAFVDSDALGSLLAFNSFLQRQGAQTQLFAYGGVPNHLLFLLEGVEVNSEPTGLDPAKFETIIVLDCSDLELTRLPDLANFSDKTINIDHHPDNPNFGQLNIVRPDYSATAEIVYDLFKSEGIIPSGFEATSILAGIMGDTGSFRFSNTSERTLNLAGELLEAGAKLPKIVRYLFTGKSSEQLKAWSYVLEHAHFDRQSGAIMAAMTSEEIDNLGVGDEAFNGIVEILNTFPGANFAAFIRQRGDEIKFSLRSENYKGVNVKEFAQKFGGGGHDLSSGFAIPGKLVKEDGVIYILPV